MRHAPALSTVQTLAVLLLCLAATLSAQEFTPLSQPVQSPPTYKPFAFGISAGMVLPGTINVEGVDVINSMSPFFKAHFDAYLIEKLSMGLYASYLMMTLDHVKGSSVDIPDAFNSASGFELGCTIKPCFRMGGQMALKPALEIGYRRMSLESTDDGINGMALGANVALTFMTGAYAPFIDAGFISQPVGGNEFVDVSWAPIFTVSGGIEF